MKKLAVILALLIFIITPTIALASVATPDIAYALYRVDAYQSAIETGDQLYIVTGIAKYTTNPTEGTAADLFLVRLLNSGAEITSTTFYPYFDNGYDYFVAAIYLTASEATGLWSSTNVTIELSGNPAYTWTAGDPPINVATISWSSATDVAGAIRARLLITAVATQNAWNDLTNYILTESVAGVPVLSTQGEEYFTNTVPNLRVICPQIFYAYQQSVNVEEKTYSGTYANALGARLIGTFLDMTPLGSMVGLSGIWISTLVWLIISFVAALWMVNKLEDRRLLAVCIFFLMPFGGLLGFMSLYVCAGLSALVVLALVYYFSWRSSS